MPYRPMDLRHMIFCALSSAFRTMGIPLQGPESERFPRDWEYHSRATRSDIFASPDLIYGGPLVNISGRTFLILESSIEESKKGGCSRICIRQSHALTRSCIFAPLEVTPTVSHGIISEVGCDSSGPFTILIWDLSFNYYRAAQNVHRN